MTKRILITCLALGALFSNLLPAQNNVLKGRLLGLPGNNPLAYTFGIGYERYFGGHFSGQLLLVSHGFGFAASDGSSRFTTALIPELKVFVLKKKRWSPFAGIFLEKAWKKDAGGGECEICTNSHSRETSSGIVLGQNLPLGKRFGLELYGGPKWRYGSTEKSTYDVATGDTTKETTDYQKPGWRLGWNLRYIF